MRLVSFVTQTVAVTGSVEVANDAGNPLPVTGAVLLDPPSTKVGRTSIRRTQALANAASTLYAVTAGKTLYVTSFWISAYNTGNAAGDLRVRDGVGGADRLPMVIPPASGIGQAALSERLAGVAVTFPEPMQFATNFRVEIVAGAVTYACAFAGYEQ